MTIGADMGGGGIDAESFGAVSIGTGGGAGFRGSLARIGDPTLCPFVLAERANGAPDGGAGVVPGKRDMDLDIPWPSLADEGVRRNEFLIEANMRGIRDSSFLGSRSSVTEDGVLS